jgi:hypothetical protein
MAAFTIAGERGKKPVHRLRAAATAIVQMSLYYSILMFAQAARGTLVTTRLASDTSDLRAFAVRAPQGTLRVCLINQNVARDERVARRGNRVLRHESDGKAIRPSRSKKGVSGETLASEWKIGSFIARNSIRIYPTKRSRRSKGLIEGTPGIKSQL